MKLRKILAAILTTALIITALCFYRCPVQKKAIAQDKIKITNGAEWFVNPKDWLENRKINYKNQYIVLGLLKLYREYSVECYADSQYTEIHFMDWLEEKYKSEVGRYDN